jgi:hypothetical protein
MLEACSVGRLAVASTPRALVAADAACRGRVRPSGRSPRLGRRAGGRAGGGGWGADPVTDRGVGFDAPRRRDRTQVQRVVAHPARRSTRGRKGSTTHRALPTTYREAVSTMTFILPVLKDDGWAGAASRRSECMKSDVALIPSGSAFRIRPMTLLCGVRNMSPPAEYPRQSSPGCHRPLYRRKGRQIVRYGFWPQSDETNPPGPGPTQKTIPVVTCRRLRHPGPDERLKEAQAAR